MNVRMPVKMLAMRLNRPDHAGHHIPALERALCFRLETHLGTGSNVAQQHWTRKRMVTNGEQSRIGLKALWDTHWLLRFNCR